MGALFFISSQQCFSTLSAAELFIAEKKLFLHEYISGYYRVSVYFLSKTLSDISIRTTTSLIISCIIYVMIGFKSTVEAFFIFTLTLALIAYTSAAMCMAISADKNAVGFTSIFVNIIFVIMMIFSGFLVNLASLMDWMAWLKYFSIPRYGLAALKINEFVGLTFCEDAVMQNSTMSAICTGEQYLDYLGTTYTTWGLWQNHVALIGMAFIFLLITYLKLRFIKKFT
ncbi:hypothetical protein LDENG_00055460 [Lucifuga dentata]|nr:hypothetical protein LDENG_00055460 [Lucifuga dentata]